MVFWLVCTGNVFFTSTFGTVLTSAAEFDWAWPPAALLMLFSLARFKSRYSLYSSGNETQKNGLYIYKTRSFVLQLTKEPILTLGHFRSLVNVLLRIINTINVTHYGAICRFEINAYSFWNTGTEMDMLPRSASYFKAMVNVLCYYLLTYCSLKLNTGKRQYNKHKIISSYSFYLQLPLAR